MSKQANSYQSNPKNKLDRMIIKIRTQGLIFDNSILSFYILKSYDNSNNTHFSRKCSVKIDFNILKRIINISGKIYVTPHILTEVSTAIRDATGNVLKEKVWLCSIDFLIQTTEEHYDKKDIILKNEHLPKFGITDIGIICIKESKELEKPPVLLTTDGNLKGLCNKYGYCDIIELQELESLISELPKD